MLMLGPLGFTAPWVLSALLLLPMLWFLLRAMPPSPRLLRFPAVGLLLGLRDRSPQAARTPWWLLVLRMLAVAAAITAFAGPVWRPVLATGASGPLVLVVDAGWAAAPGWQEKVARGLRALDEAQTGARPVALVLADGQDEGVTFATGAELADRLRAARPQPWETRYPDPKALADAPAGLSSLWLSDGLEHPGREDFLKSLRELGPVRVVTPMQAAVSLALADGDEPGLILRHEGGEWAVRAMGPDPQGTERELARLTPGDSETGGGIITAQVPIALQPELRNRITRFEVEGGASAGAVVLADDRVKRRKVGLVGSGADQAEGQQLLSPLHYIRRALVPVADLVEGGLSDVIRAAPDVIVLADVPEAGFEPALLDWVNEGGLLIRFAGPRMAASESLSQEPLLPVRLRAGGRDIGGALSWGDPRGLAPFDENGPFGGLVAPDEVTIRAQLMAEPGPELAAREIARLSDNTPLVTRDVVGQGQVVLFHVTANAEWSSLPLSGLFVEMLTRLMQSARSEIAVADGTTAEQPFWQPVLVLDGFGRASGPGEMGPVAARDFAEGPKPGVPAGLYQAGERSVALAAGGPMQKAEWPGAVIETATGRTGVSLRGWLLALAALVLALDAFASALVMRGGRVAA